MIRRIVARALERVLTQHSDVFAQLARIDERLGEVEREIPGRCAWCGVRTDGTEVYWCSDEHRRVWLAHRGTA